MWTKSTPAPPPYVSSRKSMWICSYCRNAARKTKALLECSNSCLNRPLPRSPRWGSALCMKTFVNYTAWKYPELTEHPAQRFILQPYRCQDPQNLPSSLFVSKLCSFTDLSTHPGEALPLWSPQSVKSNESVKCPSQHVQLSRKKLALLVWKEVHWHGAVFFFKTYYYYSPLASSARYLFIFSSIESTAFFFLSHLLTAWPVWHSLTEQIMAGYLFP